MVQIAPSWSDPLVRTRQDSQRVLRGCLRVSA